VLGEWELALGDGLEERRLSAAILAQETVSAAVVDLERGVVEEDLSVEHKGGRNNLDVAGLLERGEHTSGDTVGQTVLVLLHGELLDFLVEFEVLLAIFRIGLGGALGVGLGRQLGGGCLLGLRVGVSGALRLTGGFRGGDHGVLAL
jgi:hypothetical protein